MSHIRSQAIKFGSFAVALSTGWQKLKVQAWGLFCSAIDHVATTIKLLCVRQQENSSKNKCIWHKISLWLKLHSCL